eukprot:CAMPEP_0197030098 /NCGR_PEP_ID=MMETSP1384-20130603/9405_1 /TAXON_ID=29189 /ORGANISM="Ammonia sp." /LENGTH=181 /DNA_ID=CAMNT_0042459381 /DNA_START=11 /DNA_END=556 /DNA_ORIENTATION=+
MKIHDSCNRSYRHSLQHMHHVSINTKPISEDRASDSFLTYEGETASVLSSGHPADVELDAKHVLDFMLNLNQSELMKGWKCIDKQYEEKINVEAEVEPLLRHYVKCYVEYKLPYFISLTEDQGYATKTVEIAEELKRCLLAVLVKYEIPSKHQFVTAEWFVEHFQSMLKQINTNDNRTSKA